MRVGVAPLAIRAVDNLSLGVDITTRTGTELNPIRRIIVPYRSTAADRNRKLGGRQDDTNAIANAGTDQLA